MYKDIRTAHNNKARDALIHLRALKNVRIIRPTGRNILKEWILAESQTTF
jgi:hypothetical protein